jgi:hypothetical protein
VYKINKGEIPEGLEVMHSCDNPACINPEHLSVGTHQQNIQDAVTRGRMKISNKISPSDIIEIRQKHMELLKYYTDKFDVCDITILNIMRRRTWNKTCVMESKNLKIM